MDYNYALQVFQVEKGIQITWEKNDSFHSWIYIQWRGIFLHFELKVNNGRSSSTQSIEITYQGVYYQSGIGRSTAGAGTFGTTPRFPKIETPTHTFDFNGSKNGINMLERPKFPNVKPLEEDHPFKIIRNPDMSDLDGSKSEYVTFLIYDQISSEQSHSIIELAYKIRPYYESLLIRETNRQLGSINYFERRLQTHRLRKLLRRLGVYNSDANVLRDFITDFLSRTKNFNGDPVYLSSSIFSRDEFVKMKNKAAEIRDR